MNEFSNVTDSENHSDHINSIYLEGNIVEEGTELPVIKKCHKDYVAETIVVAAGGNSNITEKSKMHLCNNLRKRSAQR